MAGGDDDRTLGIERRDHQLSSGRGARTHIDDAAARLAQGGGRRLGKSRSRRACITGEDDGIARHQGSAKSRGKASNDLIGERLADETANPRNADDERSTRHNFFLSQSFSTTSVARRCTPSWRAALPQLTTTSNRPALPIKASGAPDSTSSYVRQSPVSTFAPRRMRSAEPPRRNVGGRNVAYQVAKAIDVDDVAGDAASRFTRCGFGQAHRVGNRWADRCEVQAATEVSSQRSEEVATVEGAAQVGPAEVAPGDFIHPAVGAVEDEAEEAVVRTHPQVAAALESEGAAAGYLRRDRQRPDERCRAGIRTRRGAAQRRQPARLGAESGGKYPRDGPPVRYLR